LGTELDGAATNDFVEFSTVVRAESAMATIDLLSDLAGRPLLDEAHLAAERAVILQEIADEQEDPATRAGDRLIAALFRGHRLAKSTVGDPPDVQHLTHDQLLGFRDRQWSPRGGVVAIAGNLEHLDRNQLAELLLRIPDRPLPPPAPPTPPFVRRVDVEERDSDVVHLRLAYSVPGLDRKRRRDRAIAEVYSQLIGGPMGARLCDELREKRALCYWIEGYVWGYEDAAFLSVNCSVRAADLAETYERVEAIVADLRANGPTDEEATRARLYAIGAATLDFESSGEHVDHALELIMEYGDHDVDPMLHLRAIEAVTHNDLTELTASVELGPCVGSVGPVTTADFQ
jgi:predicted Zn-dependent peptidase